VLAFSPCHNVTLADMSAAEIVPVIQAWTNLFADYVAPSSTLATKPPRRVARAAHGAEEKETPEETPGEEDEEGEEEQARQFGRRNPRGAYHHMQIFENKGAAMGCSNPHPHGQVWITTALPDEPRRELEQLQQYRRLHGGAHMLEEYARLECGSGGGDISGGNGGGHGSGKAERERIVCENGAFVALCPWWAVWPFEVMVLSKAHKRALVDLSESDVRQLADVISEITRRYDNLFECHFPYSEHPLRYIPPSPLLPLLFFLSIVRAVFVIC
jgi:UDPglucose--hexose-1-phosphate uridylyltransferase